MVALTETEPLSALKRFAGSAPQRERCELCGLALDAVHPHLLERNARAVVCACSACALLFSSRQDGKYLRIPTSVRIVDALSLDALHWEELGLPINLAFFFRDAEGKLRAMYPSPAGAIESSLPFEDKTVGAPSFSQSHCEKGGKPQSEHAIVGTTVQPEVEALLVSRIQGEEAAFILPIDECFRLTGLIRTHWRGLSGGTEVWKFIRAFLAEMRTRAEAGHA